MSNSLPEWATAVWPTLADRMAGATLEATDQPGCVGIQWGADRIRLHLYPWGYRAVVISGEHILGRAEAPKDSPLMSIFAAYRYGLWIAEEGVGDAPERASGWAKCIAALWGKP